jgi:hypothetical protein
VREKTTLARVYKSRRACLSPETEKVQTDTFGEKIVCIGDGMEENSTGKKTIY